MKKIYTISIVAFIVLFSGCSKDFLKSYNKRIVGTWNIDYVNVIGLGGSSSNLPFNNGSITFFANGSLEYSNSANRIFKGTWDIVKKTQGDEFLRSLQVSAVDFTSHEVLTQYYDDMNFTGTNRFKATINSNLHTYVTHFSR
jgi:hypothetical protein